MWAVTEHLQMEAVILRNYKHEMALLYHFYDFAYWCNLRISLLSNRECKQTEKTKMRMFKHKNGRHTSGRTMSSFDWIKFSRLIKSLAPEYASPAELPAAKNSNLQHQMAHGTKSTSDSFANICESVWSTVMARKVWGWPHIMLCWLHTLILHAHLSNLHVTVNAKVRHGLGNICFFV